MMIRHRSRAAPVAKIGSEKIPAYAMGTANELVVDETFQR